MPTMFDIANPTPKQREAYISMASKLFTLAGGAAGGGKSRCCRWGPLIYLVDFAFGTRGVRNAEVGVFCETYGTLDDRQVRKARTEFPQDIGKFRVSKAGPNFHLNENLGGGVILFRNLDNADKYYSSEFAAIFVDEITKNLPGAKESPLIQTLFSRRRWTGLSHCPFFAATNPGGPLHAQVKKIWVDQNPPSNLREKYSLDQFSYVPFKATDNPYLDQSYLDTLDALEEPLRSALRDGNWDAFSGMFFTTFDRAELVVPPFRIPDDWRLYAGMDPGWANPLSFGLYAIEPVHRESGDGHIYKVGQYYERERTPKQHAEAIRVFLRETLKPWTGGRFPLAIFSGHDAWAMKDRYSVVGTDATMEQEFSNARLSLVRAKTERRQGWGRFRAAITHRVLQFFDGMCEPTIEQMESIEADERDREDIRGRGNDSQIEDHALDETRYALMSIFKPKAPARPGNPKRPLDYRKKEPKKDRFSSALPKDWRGR